jgi:RNA polymerase sigma-70 factor (ECF subfamily)
MQVPDFEPTPSQAMEAADTRQMLEVAIAQMKPEDAALISLYYQAERSVKEIAEITGLTESNIKVKLFRLRSTLKGILERQLKTEVKQLL